MKVFSKTLNVYVHMYSYPFACMHVCMSGCMYKGMNFSRFGMYVFSYVCLY